MLAQAFAAKLPGGCVPPQGTSTEMASAVGGGGFAGLSRPHEVEEVY
jgi:hypothetical protein